jgi:hypothetical protein
MQISLLALLFEKLYPIPRKWRNHEFVSRDQQQEQFTGAGEELRLRSAAAPEVRLCAKYSSLVHFNLNQNIQQNIVSQKRV